MYTSKEILQEINKYIDELQFERDPQNLYAPIRYVLEKGGKRMRCILMTMAYNMYKDDIVTIFPKAAGLETYHNFTLLHDDLMDKADMRRGKPTVHKKWNDNAAILSGDAMIILAYQLICKGDATNHSKIIDTFSEIALGVCEGQQYDIDFESRDDVTIPEYMEMIRLKTSVLLGGAVKIGALAAGATEDDANSLYSFGEKIGLAFQLQDDLLDVYGDPKVFGKKIGGDILCNKKTFMLLSAYQHSNDTQKSELEKWVAATDFDPEEKISAVKAIYDAVGIKEICLAKINELYDEGMQSLDKVDVVPERKECLRGYVKELMQRDK